MNLFVADPEWGWWITGYFFLGGIAAGAYFMATLIDLAGREEDRELARIGYWIAFPLVGVCGLFLILDLTRPERFWHMLFRSELVHQAFREGWPWTGRSWETMSDAPLMKVWSPMSVGSWALLLFGPLSALSFVGSLWPGGRFERWLRLGVFGRALLLLGCAVGFFVAAYTGVLLTATNQPVWSDTVWIAPLFLTSAASTGLATMMVLAHRRGVADRETMNRLERADVWVLALELVVFAVFVASLGPGLADVFAMAHGKVLIIGTAVLGLLLPLAIHLRLNASRRAALAAAGFALLGGFLLRYGIVNTPPELLAHGGKEWRFSPEDGRARGGGPGADPINRLGPVDPRTKMKP